MARRLGQVAPRYLAEGFVLPQDDDALYVLYFHVDPPREDDAHFFAHLIYTQRPASPPPEEVEARRERGATMEWVHTSFEKMTLKSQRYFVDVRLRTRHTGHRSVALAPPRKIDGTVFEFIGAEFEARGGAGGGLRGFSWREGPGDMETFELRYVAQGMDWSDPWQGEERRCPTYLDRVI